MDELFQIIVNGIATGVETTLDRAKTAANTVKARNRSANVYVRGELDRAIYYVA